MSTSGHPSGPEGSNPLSSGQKINEQHVDVTDWSQNCVPIGVALKEPTHWMGASEEDLKIIAALLLKPLTLVGPHGIIASPALAEGSEFLRSFGKWAEGAAAWCASNPSKIP